MSKFDTLKQTRKIYIQTSVPGAEPTGFYDELIKNQQLDLAHDLYTVDDATYLTDLLIQPEEYTQDWETTLQDYHLYGKHTNVIALDFYTPIAFIKQRLFLQKSNNLLSQETYDNYLDLLSDESGLYHPSIAFGIPGQRKILCGTLAASVLLDSF